MSDRALEKALSTLLPTIAFCCTADIFAASEGLAFVASKMLFFAICGGFAVAADPKDISSGRLVFADSDKPAFAGSDDNIVAKGLVFFASEGFSVLFRGSKGVVFTVSDNLAFAGSEGLVFFGPERFPVSFAKFKGVVFADSCLVFGTSKGLVFGAEDIVLADAEGLSVVNSKGLVLAGSDSLFFAGSALVNFDGFGFLLCKAAGLGGTKTSENVSCSSSKAKLDLNLS